MVIACSALRNPEIAASAGDGGHTRARRTLVRRFHREISPSCSAHLQPQPRRLRRLLRDFRTDIQPSGV
jgi:hypothetical protein